MGHQIKQAAGSTYRLSPCQGAAIFYRYHYISASMRDAMHSFRSRVGMLLSTKDFPDAVSVGSHLLGDDGELLARNLHQPDCDSFIEGEGGSLYRDLVQGNPRNGVSDHGHGFSPFMAMRGGRAVNRIAAGGASEMSAQRLRHGDGSRERIIPTPIIVGCDDMSRESYFVHARCSGFPAQAPGRKGAA